MAISWDAEIYSPQVSGNRITFTTRGSSAPEGVWAVENSLPTPQQGRK